MPGWCVDRTVFDDIGPKLTKNNRVLSLDWRSHGDSERPEYDFDGYELVEDALAVIESSGAEKIIPVALAHAGWIAIALRRRLGERIKKLVLVDWIVTEPPPAFMQVVRGLQTPQWQDVRDRLLEIWRGGIQNEKLETFLRDVVSKYDGIMWARAARSIEQAYRECGSPLQELSKVSPPLPVLHLYAQPADSGFAEMQAAFTAKNPWYSYHRLSAKSHFAMFEVPDEVACVIAQFLSREVKRTAA